MHDDVRLTQPGHFGTPSRGVALAPATIGVAWNVQGDLDRVEFAAATRVVFDIVLPVAPNATTRSDIATTLWLGPRSWLVASGDASALGPFAAARDIVNAGGGALFDESAARAAWTIAGANALDVLASGCPVDLHPRVFRTGDCAQTLFGHVNALIEKRDDAPTFVLMVARSFARDVEHALASVAAQYGYDVLASRPY